MLIICSRTVVLVLVICTFHTNPSESISSNNFPRSIIEASMVGDAASLKFLISQNNQDINQRDHDGRTALMKVGYDPQLEDYSGNLKAALDCVDILLGHGGDVNLIDNHGWTALMFAATVGKTAQVELLVQAGATVDALDMRYKRSALYMATVNGYIDTVKALIDAGADVNISTREGWNPLMIAVRNAEVLDDEIDSIESWKNGGHEASDPFKPPVQDRLGVVHLLLSHGANPDNTDEAGRTPLMLGCQMGRLEVVRLLLAHGADATLRDTAGHSAQTWGSRAADATSDRLESIRNAMARGDGGLREEKAVELQSLQWRLEIIVSEVQEHLLNQIEELHSSWAEVQDKEEDEEERRRVQQQQEEGGGFIMDENPGGTVNAFARTSKSSSARRTDDEL